MLLSGIEFVRFKGTTCAKNYQYGDFKSLQEAKLGCISDQDFIAFHAIQPGCKEWRERHSHLGMPISRKDDYKLCKKNASLTNAFEYMRKYELRVDPRITQSVKPTEDCFHDVFVKSYEPGIISS